MRRPTPKTMRKIKRRPIVLEPGIRWHDCTQTFIVGSGGSRVDKLPPFDEYNPNRVHVARRRQANKDHHSFPRGWTIQYDTGSVIISDPALRAIQLAGWPESTEDSEDDCTIDGSVYI